MSIGRFRVAEPADAEAFTDWTMGSRLIDPRDAQAGLKKNNPTAVCFAVENDKGEVIAFAPVYCAAMLGHLAFNPRARASERLKALEVLKDGLMAFFVQFGIREIVTKSKAEYGVAQWALKHGFELDNRNLLTLDLNKEMVVEEPHLRKKTCV